MTTGTCAFCQYFWTSLVVSSTRLWENSSTLSGQGTSAIVKSKKSNPCFLWSTKIVDEKLRLSVFLTISKFKTVLTDFLGLWISAEIFLTRGSGFEYFIIPFLALGREQRIESRLFYNTAGCFILLSCDGLSLSSWRLNRILIDLFCIILQGNMHAGCEWDNFATQWYINAFFLVSPLVVTWLRD